MELVGEHDPGTGSLVTACSAASCRPRDPREALRWVRDAARGVHDAHLRNVFHRDLTPRNLLVTPLSRRAKIADFGLAIRMDGHTTSHGEAVLDARSSVHRIAGTPQYMAPEQARGLVNSVAPSSARDRTALVGVDVWGLGAIAFDLIVGHPPWPREPNAWEIAARGDVPAVAACTNDKRVSRRVCAVVQRALAPDPAKRYASAKLLADEIDALLASRPTSFDASAWSRFLLWMQRNPKLLLTSALMVALWVSALIAYAATTHLRRERDRLMIEISESKHEVQRLEARGQLLRRDLAATEGICEVAPSRSTRCKGPPTEQGP
jgi:serine/threonine protein kinase